MPERLPPLDVLPGFVMVGRTLSMTRAAQALCLSQSAVSRQIRQLEAAVGQPLFLREHRALRLTDAGARLLLSAEAALRAWQDGVAALRDDAARQITVSASIGVIGLWLLPRLGDWQAAQVSSHQVNAILVQTAPGADADAVAAPIRRWKHLAAYTRAQMEEILVAKLIATSARQIGMFLAILAVVSAAIVAFIIYTMTLGKLREIAVLKLIGTRNRTIAAMIVQQALGLGLIGFVVGKVAATLWAPVFPKYVLLETADAARGLVAVMVICVLASTLAIRVALKVDPATAIGG